MADVKISGLPASTTPLDGTEVLPIVQGTTTKKVAVSDLTSGRGVTVGSLSNAGNLTFTGTGNRITGDFSNATLINRTSFQTSTTNGNTALYFLPNGTATVANLIVSGNSDPTNAAIGVFGIVGASELRISSAVNGTGTLVPMTFFAGGAERMRVSTAGDVSLATGNLVIGTSGKGIDFSATAGTGTSELLADYEEGTWTPVVTSQTGAITSYTVETASYTKVGRSVTVTCEFTITNNGTGATFVSVAGLPFTTGSTYRGAGCGREFGSLGTQLQIQLNSSTTTMIFFNYNNSYPGVTGGQYVLTITYFV